MNLGILKLFSIFVALGAFAQELNYSLIKKGKESNDTMLLIGGIQGDEPGGFLAASLVATDYNITKGSLWIVPNLNFPSIIKRARGVKGDMNRKFVHIDKNDPDYKAVLGIKELIKSPNVSLILNLHDGSGFYRDNFINSDKNPDKWGNTCIIDQEFLHGSKYFELEKIAQRVRNKINMNLLHNEHKYHIKNTNTAKGDMEMLKSLTYYAITQKKSAFANEASKNLNAEQRTYYHLLAIEEYMKIAGIKFTRPFELNVESVKKAIQKAISIKFFDGDLILNLQNVRSNLNYIPFKKDKFSYSASNPITAVLKEKNGYKVQYGNRFVTHISPQYFEYSSSMLKDIDIIIDGKKIVIKNGDKIQVKNNFLVPKIKNKRLNIIGYPSKLNDESNIKINKNKLINRFSIDKNANVFRLEFYDLDKNKFAGMIFVEFI